MGAGLASEGWKVWAGRRFRGLEGPGQVLGWFRANQRVGTPRLVEVVGGRKLWVGRKVRGPEVLGCAGSSGGRDSAKNRDFEIEGLGGKIGGKTQILRGKRRN